MTEDRKTEEDRPVPEANLTSLREFDPGQDIARLERSLEERIGLASDGQI